MKKESELYNLLIEKLFVINEKQSCVYAFLDILDYGRTKLSLQNYERVIKANAQFILKDKLFVSILKVNNVFKFF